MTINMNKEQTGMLNKTQQKPLKKQILSHGQQKLKSQILDFPKNLESFLCFRLNIVRQTLSYPYHFEFHLEKYGLFAMYTNNKRYTIF